MTTQALTLPVDIPWRRLAYAADMIDTNFGDIALPPKWRSSLAVYYYVVEQEQTAESYPEGRIVYLRLTCSITGWNPSEELQAAVSLEEVGDNLDDLQRATWEAIQSSGWAEAYWPCLGAIAQIAIYPNPADGVHADDYPFIQDFEPKKRELFETVTDTGEYLSGSSEKIDVQKGTTSTDSTEKSDIMTGGGVTIPVGGAVGLGANISGEWGTRKTTGTQAVDMHTTDSARERRETVSHSTTFSQMYQLFNGYHLGTNRAVFLIAPRPHTASQTQRAGQESELAFNLIQGQRALEGIQDMFLVVHVPTKLQGICIQASLDTGHQVFVSAGAVMKTGPGAEPPRDGHTEPPPPPPPGTDQGVIVYSQLVVTRRVIQNCGEFDQAGNLTLAGVPAVAGLPRLAIVHEALVPSPTLVARTADTSNGGRATGQALLADEMNLFQREVTAAMRSGFSAGRYKPRDFVETATFRRLVAMTLRDMELSLDRLVQLNYLTTDVKGLLDQAGVGTLGGLFGRAAEESREITLKELDELRSGLIDKVLNVAER